MSPMPSRFMHFTPLGQIEMAAPTGLISCTASNTSQLISGCFKRDRRAQAADTGTHH
ncbi:Uncharacterised protein [Raoultella terrigena]|uniref:Uncharacterized protein n=1 Tax=Raoultella terrigena TaxID=577 RepID=A0A4U9DHF1_RAOTE|nr:Uncharacterised protein [Raoultella terrigena]